MSTDFLLATIADKDARILELQMMLHEATKKETATSSVPAATNSVPASSVPAATITLTKPKYSLRPSDTEFRIHADYLGNDFISEAMNITWNRKISELKNLVVGCTSNDGWIQVHTSEPTKECFFPKLKTVGAKNNKNPNDYNVLFVIRKDHERGVTYKAALQHKDTNEIVLLTSGNFKWTIKRFDSKLTGWYVCNTDMIAPAYFWQLLNKAIN